MSNRAYCLAGRPQRRSRLQSAAGEPHAVNFDALPLPDISFEVRVPLCLPPCQARGRLWRKPDRRHRPWIRTEKLPSAAMAQLPFGGTPSSLCAESAAMSGSPDRSTGVPRACAPAHCWTVSVAPGHQSVVADAVEPLRHRVNQTGALGGDGMDQQSRHFGLVGRGPNTHSLRTNTPVGPSTETAFMTGEVPACLTIRASWLRSREKTKRYPKRATNLLIRFASCRSLTVTCRKV